MHKELFGNDWDEVLDDEFEKTYYSKLREFLKKEYEEEMIHPQIVEVAAAVFW